MNAYWQLALSFFVAPEKFIPHDLRQKKIELSGRRYSLPPSTGRSRARESDNGKFLSDIGTEDVRYDLTVE